MAHALAPRANSTINIRIDASLKERGDEVLKQNGISTTAAIKMLWEELAQTHQLPKFIIKRQQKNSSSEIKRKLALLDKLTGIAELSPEEQASLPTYEQLRDEMYEDMYRKYLELG